MKKLYLKMILVCKLKHYGLVFRAQVDWTFILPLEFPVKATPLAEKNASVQHHVLRSLINLHSEHSVYPISTYVVLFPVVLNFQSSVQWVGGVGSKS
jgi:hypothetical protein